MIKKNEEYIVDIMDNGFQGEGIAKIENFTVFIPNCLKGEKVKILIVKVLKSYAFGKIIEILEASKYRVKEDCETYKRCGGCSLRHIEYSKTLEIKRNAVQSLVNKTLKSKIEVEETLGMDMPYYYRNKIQYPVGLDKNGVPQIGVFASRSHEIIPIKECLIQNKEGEKIAKEVFEYWKLNKYTFYDEKTQKGLLRHIIVKVGIKTNEYMCILVINGDKFPEEKKLVDEITKKFTNLKTIVLNSNKKNTNVIMGDSNRVLYGDGFIKDKLGEYIFKISPQSFYQVNPIQAERLYSIAVKQANISSEDIVFDLYSGIGTISLFLSQYAKKVYGVEIVEEAVNMAKENAILNSVNNVEFIAGDVEQILTDLLSVKKIVPDVVVVDPPRKGLDSNSIDNLIKVLPRKIVYISCNPATMVRDIALLEEKYQLKNVKPVDMFPFTSHVECVALMGRKDNEGK